METGAGAPSTTQLDENELLLAVARGDVEAMRLLYRAFERPLYSLGIRWLNDPALAEELVQEVTIRIWRRATNFDPARGAAAAWIFGIARNVASDLARAEGRKPLPLAEPRPEAAAPWDDEAAWRGWQVAQAMRTLSEDQQKVIELAYVNQFTQSEIARALGIPLGTVKTRLYQGLARLRAKLSSMGLMGGGAG